MGLDRTTYWLRYDLPSMNFRAFLEAALEADRHLFHEAGHDWVGALNGLAREEARLAPGAVSTVTLAGDGVSTHAWLLAGVAGILAEAKGVRYRESMIDRLDVGRMGKLAEAVAEEVLAHRKDMEYGFPVFVPMGPSRSSMEPASCSVADFAVPLGRDEFSAKGVLAALEEVSGLLNGGGWGDFLAHVTRFDGEVSR